MTRAACQHRPRVVCSHHLAPRMSGDPRISSRPSITFDVWRCTLCRALRGRILVGLLRLETPWVVESAAP